MIVDHYSTTQAERGTCFTRVIDSLHQGLSNALLDVAIGRYLAHFVRNAHLLPPPDRAHSGVRTGTVCFMGVGNGRTVDFSHWICYYLVRPLVSSPGWYLTRLYVQHGSEPGAWSGALAKP